VEEVSDPGGHDAQVHLREGKKETTCRLMEKNCSEGAGMGDCGRPSYEKKKKK